MTETDDVRQHLRAFWDRDSHTYDHAEGHWPRSPVVHAAWRGALAALLPPPPARVLDVGAGTGFLSLTLAGLGYQVTASDSAPGMLERIMAKSDGLDIEVVETDATQPPPGPFDAVVERHLIWTLPDPATALTAWRQAAPDGRLVLVESVWGQAADLPQRLRARARRALRTLRRVPDDHHAAYQPGWYEALPFGGGTTPRHLVDLVAENGWGPARLHRLRDVEWAALSTLPPWERLLGVPPHFVIVGGS